MVRLCFGSKLVLMHEWQKAWLQGRRVGLRRVERQRGQERLLPMFWSSAWIVRQIFIDFDSSSSSSVDDDDDCIVLYIIEWVGELEMMGFMWVV